jgi:hypothetical protein
MNKGITLLTCEHESQQAPAGLQDMWQLLPRMHLDHLHHKITVDKFASMACIWPSKMYKER